MYPIEAESPSGTKYINRRCWVKDEGSERQVWLNYALFMRYPKNDATSQRFVVACLAQADVAPKTKIARAFSYHRNYVARLAAELEERGVEAMLAGKPGPKRPHKLHEEIRRWVRRLHKRGVSLGAIARRLREEWGIKASRRSLGRIVQQGAVGSISDAVQASLDSAWPLALPLSSSTSILVDASTKINEAMARAPEAEGESDAPGVVPTRCEGGGGVLRCR